VQVLENGYDEESFSDDSTGAAVPLMPGAITLLHSGIVYPSERDPTQLMAALHRLSDAGHIVPGRLVLRFRAAVAEDLLRRLAAEHGVEAYIEVAPALPYREALCEMQRADGLLVMQASNCNAQIPAKLYEYLRAGRPILCLSDPVGDTADLMRRAGIDTIVPLDSVDAIADILPRFMSQVRAGLAPLAAPSFVANASRRARSQQFAQLLERSVA
jgi:glycosyltransferase involved in cell wall biosynthesis